MLPLTSWRRWCSEIGDELISRLHASFGDDDEGEVVTTTEVPELPSGLVPNVRTLAGLVEPELADDMRSDHETDDDLATDRVAAVAAR